jgi:hypothetical protein
MAMSVVNTVELTKLVEIARQRTELTGLLDAIQNKLILLAAAQSAAKAGASQELLCQILDESN